MSEHVKQVIILRKDLNMRKGKMAAQAAHASMKVFFDNIEYCDHGEMKINNISPEAEAWIYGSFTKICVSVDSEDELLNIVEQAWKAKLPCSIIKDSGLTEFNGTPTYTAVAIGPAKSNVIDKITGKLKLL